MKIFSHCKTYFFKKGPQNSTSFYVFSGILGWEIKIFHKNIEKYPARSGKFSLLLASLAKGGKKITVCKFSRGGKLLRCEKFLGGDKFFFGILGEGSYVDLRWVAHVCIECFLEMTS